jgi:putative transposase
MSTDELSGQPVQCVRTLRFKIKAEAYPWLNAAAREVNVVWNFANEVSARAARPFVGRPTWLSAYDLDTLTAGATEWFAHIGSDTIQRVISSSVAVGT